MKTFLWFLLIVVVSGDEESVDVTIFLNENVLLPCTCENRALNEELRWQKEKGKLPEQPVWSSKNTLTNFSGRVETFFNNNTNNCSILLKKVTEDDQGKYTCCFNSPNYQYQFVNLRVCGSEPCHQNVTLLNGVFKCDVNSSDSTTVLQWTLNEEPLKNFTNYKMSNNFTLKDGISHVTSTLQNLTEVISISELKCTVTRLTQSSLWELKAQPTDAPRDTTVSIIALVVVVVLVLVVGLVLLVVFKLKHTIIPVLN